MHYFNIHTQQGGHLGLPVMLADDGAEVGPKDGQFAVKLQSESSLGGPQADMLRSLEQEGKPLPQRAEEDRVELFCNGRNIGSVHNEYLAPLEHSLVLNDLAGMIWMESMFILVPINIILVFVIGYFFWWLGKNGQFDDLESPMRCISTGDDSTDKLIDKDDNDDPEKR